MMNIQPTIVSPSHLELRALIAKLDQELMERYPTEKIFGVDFDDPKVKEMTFVVAYDGDVPAGCGAIRPLGDKVVEIKRFYVAPAYRRKGVASRILSFLEQLTAEGGYTCIRLETGKNQDDAVGLYEKFGFGLIPCYGEYEGCEDSICYEKQLDVI
ncbi:GNAT family N-acetyltransferase [Paenibacillus sp. 481]|uniref:GNAT family N-acetyltransferase n=1 Tax=Paenibacillus sp. 481 TaxID=2835869 RepID=UPI001E5CDF35|nr:GNAT family N-acetyltransferase [Paenibacillus sp. 481]UHA72688.1 GNAT family N-acetyltransferase [Paenibacillus sp. 481]